MGRTVLQGCGRLHNGFNEEGACDGRCYHVSGAGHKQCYGQTGILLAQLLIPAFSMLATALLFVAFVAQSVFIPVLEP